jgi:hypothetical protein
MVAHTGYGSAKQVLHSCVNAFFTVSKYHSASSQASLSNPLRERLFNIPISVLEQCGNLLAEKRKHLSLMFLPG